MDIKQIHDWIKFLGEKHNSGYWSDIEIDRALDFAQIDYMNELFGSPRTYQPGRMVPVIGYGATITISDALAPFRKKYAFSTSNTLGGVVTLPEDYAHCLSISVLRWHSGQYRNIPRKTEVVNEDELIERLESQLMPVSLYSPIALVNVAGKIQLYPEQPQQGDVWYLRKPKAPQIAYGITGRNRWYDAENSIQLEWSDLCVNAIIMKAMRYLGLNLGSADIIGLSDQIQKEGS